MYDSMIDKHNREVTTINSPRTFLRQSVGLTLAATAFGQSGLALASQPDRRLRLINDHTWEKLDIVYWTHGVYVDESLIAINKLMRDHRANVIKPMDIKLIDQLHRLQSQFDTAEQLHILSGYRTPATNAKLRKRSSGVAKFSLHMEARAADIYIPGIKARTLQKTALAMKSGGVGYYGRSGFVHVDTGRVRHWEQA
jgi:uncharacterized protein YcbK (DUF882 family)